MIVLIAGHGKHWQRLQSNRAGEVLETALPKACWHLRAMSPAFPPSFYRQMPAMCTRTVPVALCAQHPHAIPGSMKVLLSTIAAKKQQLDKLRPMSIAALAGLQKSYDVELTFTSNAIEGNTLTLRETAELIEHGITVGGKPLRDHLEAVDHYNAVLLMRELAAQTTPINETTVCELHRRIVARSQPDIGGFYSTLPRRIAGSPVVFPNPAKIPQLMKTFGDSLTVIQPLPEDSFAAHFRLVAIHPFADGNGRTARLLMNLLLLRQGYPPVAVHPQDRISYLDALEHASMRDDLVPFQTFMHQRLGDTLTEYLKVLGEV